MLHAAFDSVTVTLVGFLGLLRALRVTDELLFDIPPDEEDAPLKYTRARNLRIDDLSDMAALKMTHFNHSQLRRLYELFDLESQLEPMSDKLAIPTGFNVNGTPCRYRIHPEEVYLFMLCKVATGMTQVNIVEMCMPSSTGSTHKSCRIKWSRTKTGQLLVCPTSRWNYTSSSKELSSSKLRSSIQSQRCGNSCVMLGHA